MLVVDGVELRVLQQSTHPRVLDLHDTACTEQGGKSPHESAQIRDVGHHVVGEHHIRRTVLGHKCGRGLGPEELLHGRDAYG